ncbi:hypothetical protein J5N97_009851 [Dioscorea zingiberensis]|uniref:Retrovirus-related Pol polyprotein from transposon TNT 1-94 n=1 Tax=Dioscorea zingiberensis TaxID=325984 RepID=A0A9D5CXY1_9LILI|nr:hypothetical protein J5N97_009851 [Dioscorea zingiberensis]
MQQDQMVLNALLASLSEEILSQILFLTTSHEVWSSLEQSFSSRSRARIIQLKIQLSTIQKKEIPVPDYFQKVKNLADTPAAIGQPLQDDEVFTYILAGLGSEFVPLVTSINTRTDPISLTDLYAHLLSYKTRLEHNNTVFKMTSNNTYRSNKGERSSSSCSSGHSCGRSNGPRSDDNPRY